MNVLGFIRRTFTRDTISTRFIPEIDGLRFLAIGMVFVYHLCHYVGVQTSDRWRQVLASRLPAERLYDHFNFGVQLFFVISGFVLALPFATARLVEGGRPAPTFGSYLWRRVTRLEPPYVLNLLLFFSFLVLTHRAAAAELFPHLAASIFYVHNAVYGEPGAVNVVAWSLEIEVQFYLLAPFLAALVYRGPRAVRRAALLAAAVLAMAAQCFLITTAGGVKLSLLDNIQYFLAGFFLADLYVVDWKKQPTRGLAGDVAFVAGWVGFVAAITAGGEFVRFVPPFAFLAVAYGTLRGKAAGAALSLGFPVAVGGMCYTVYLYHGILIALAIRATGRVVVTDSYTLNLLLQAALIGPPTVVICGALFALVERPCMDRDWPRKVGGLLFRRKPPLAAAP